MNVNGRARAQEGCSNSLNFHLENQEICLVAHYLEMDKLKQWTASNHLLEEVQNISKEILHIALMSLM